MKSSPESSDTLPAPSATPPRPRGTAPQRLPAPTSRQTPPLTEIWVVSTVHRPDDVRIFWKQSISLASAGYSVTALFWTDDPHAAGDQIIAGVRRLVLWRGPASSGLRRRCSVLFRTLRLCARSHCHNFLFHDPELILAGLVLQRLGKRVIYDAHEDLPSQVLHKPYFSNWQRKIARYAAAGLVHSANRWLSAQLCATATIQQRFPERSCLVRNFPLLREFTLSSPPPRSSQSTACQIAYVGGLAPSRGVLELVQAVNLLNSSASLVLAGPWESEEFRLHCQKADHQGRVTYAGVLDRQGVGNLLRSSDIGVAVLHPVPAYVDALPVKLFEYMAAGIPVIVSDFPLWRGIVGNAGCGVLVQPGDVNALQVALDYLIQDPSLRQQLGSNGRTAVEQRYTWDSESARFIDFVNSVFGVGDAASPSEPLALPA